MEIFTPKNGILIDLNYPEKSKVAEAISSTKDLDFVVGYRVGPIPVLKNGLDKIADILRDRADKPVIYDHQKFGSDVPDICSGKILDYIKESGFDAIVILPLSGKEVLESIITKCTKINLLPIVCGDLPYHGYFLAEGGYITTDIQQRIYLGAASLGVSHLMMSCNRMDKIKIYCHQLDAIVGQLKIFITAISSPGCSELPDSCSQLMQKKVYAVFEKEFDSFEEYTSSLSTFWDSFRKKLKIT